MLLALATGNFGFSHFQWLYLEIRDLQRFHGHERVLFLWTGREECRGHVAALLHREDETGERRAFVRGNEDFWFARRHRAH